MTFVQTMWRSGEDDMPPGITLAGVDVTGRSGVNGDSGPRWVQEKHNHAGGRLHPVLENRGDRLSKTACVAPVTLRLAKRETMVYENMGI